MEYLQVFDKNKVMLDEKVGRPDKLNLPEGKYFMIILLFIENSKGEFLLQKTSEGRDSVIATTGGHVSLGDDGFKTVIKEAKEELGLDISNERLEYVDTLEKHPGFCEIYYLNKDIDINDLSLQEEEVDYVDWFTREDINNLINEGKLRKGNIKPFEILFDYLETREN